MNRLRIKLLLSLTIFALILVIVVSYVNRQLLLSDTREREEQNTELIENHILDDMKRVDNAHYYFDTAISHEMEQYLRTMEVKYKEDPDVVNWDLENMKKTHGMDLYILDETNTVIHTTFKRDLGLNFSECCKKFSSLLDERRESGQFFTDGIDVSMTTGEIRKFSYLASADNKYLFEISVKLDDVPVLQTFSFVETADNLVQKYDDLIDIKIANAGGVFLNKESSSQVSIEDMPQKFQDAFKKARSTMKPVEYQKKLDDGYIETHRFLPYEAENIRGESSKRVIYVKYGNDTELALLKENSKQFWLLLLLAMAIASVTLVAIIKILTKTINQATYDTLTGVYNRATYITKMEEVLQKRKSNNPGLVLIDLDNFKQVNDQYGHAKGDIVLVETAKVLERVVKNDGFVARFGGDEFAIVVKDATKEELEKIGNDILEQIHHFKKGNLENELWNLLTVSIGGAIYEEQNETEINLFVRADKALYRSKNNGKNQYSM